MRRHAGALVAGLCIAVLSIGFVGQAASEGAPLRLLLVDETKTFLSTMRVGALVGALKRTGTFEVTLRFADVASSYDDPLSEQDPPADTALFDVILILPRGLDDGSIVQIWLLSEVREQAKPGVWPAVETLSFVVDQVFEGVGGAVDVTEDLWPGFLWLAYSIKGWTR